VFTLGYVSVHTLSGQESDSGLYQEGSIFRGHLGPLAEKVPFLLMFGGNLCSKGPWEMGQNRLFWGGQERWYFGVCL